MTTGILLSLSGLLLKKTARTPSVEAGSHRIIHCINLDMGSKVEKHCPEEGEWL